MYIVKAESDQIEKIVDMSIRAFETDVNVGGREGDCPPEYDSVEWHKQMAREGHLYQAMVGKDLVGAAIVFPDVTEKSVYIGRIFIDSIYHRKGYGIRLMDCIEKSFPWADEFDLDTPCWNERTNAFYKKLGYRIIKVEDGFVFYQKRKSESDNIQQFTGKQITVNDISYRIVCLLGKGKGGYSFLAEKDGHPVVVKQIHHEPCDYYSFGNKIEAELRDYERLQKAGIRIPGMHAVDKDDERIVKDYIEGPTVMELVQAGVSVDPYLPQVRDMAAKAMAAGLNIDYYPTNFVVHDGLIWYVDYECNDYSDQWDFEHWGLQYWQPKVK